MRNLLFLINERDYFATLFPEIQEYQIVQSFSRDRKVYSFIQRLPWPMAPRQAYLMSRKFYLPEKNAVLQISTALNPGD